MPSGVALHQNYPNPFNPRTVIAYTLAQPSAVRLEGFDVQGRLVRTLVDAVQPAGEHQVVFSGEALPSGTYLYRLRTATGERIRQMTLVK